MRAITTHVWFRAFLVVALTVIAPAAEAAWEVSVKARTELRLKPIRKDYDGSYILSGQLVHARDPEEVEEWLADSGLTLVRKHRSNVLWYGYWLLVYERPTA